MRSTARDMTIIQEVLVEFARAFFCACRTPRRIRIPLLRAAVEVRIERLLDAAAARIVAGGMRGADEASAAGARAFPAAAE